MGLDMYLEVKRYVGFGEDALKDTLAATAPADLPISEFGSYYVTYPVMYWRKANAIHRWFVDNVQNHVDDCGEYRVERSQLVKLRDACKTVLGAWSADRENVAEEVGLIPTTGFFFGNTEMDEWYLNDLSRTAQEISKALDAIPEDEWSYVFQYQSSW